MKFVSAGSTLSTRINCWLGKNIPHGPFRLSGGAEPPIEKNVAHLAGQLARISVGARVVPGVNPVHHAEKCEHRNAAGKFYSLTLLEVVEQLQAYAVVLTFDGGNFRAEAVAQRVVLVRKHLHGFLVSEEIFQMVLDKDADTQLRIRDILQALAQPLEDGRKGVPLNEVEQLFFGLEIVIKPGQGDAAGAGKVAHRGAFVSFIAEDAGGVLEDFCQPPVETAVAIGGRERGQLWLAADCSGCCHYRTFVR